MIDRTLITHSVQRVFTSRSLSEPSPNFPNTPISINYHLLPIVVTEIVPLSDQSIIKRQIPLLQFYIRTLLHLYNEARF